ncbi:hypothetical protein ABT061_09335 [Streptosporangium sp. NPDC002544]|uniref:hypothetical protein n=1 Tax=Streptosporangium sp. NPDC002544 TaxID=3154538 RepID=UPI003332DFB6
MATGPAALLAVFSTARNADTARRTFQLGERGHDTDRFSKAVEQLGSDQAPVRLGGLYALEQLAGLVGEDEPGAPDHPSVSGSSGTYSEGVLSVA